MPRSWIAAVAGVLAWAAASAAAPLPDPCYDPDRPWPVYCERLSEAPLRHGDVAVTYQLYAFYEDLAGDQRPPQWVFDIEPPYRQSGIKIYDDAGTRFMSWERNVGVAWAETPRFIERGDGLFLTVPLRFAGSAGLVDDRLFRHDGGTWTAIATAAWPDLLMGGRGWIDDAEARLPAGLAIRDGVVVDFATLTATTLLWRADDAHCCPSGGEAAIRFAIVGDVLTVEAVEVRPPP